MCVCLCVHGCVHTTYNRFILVLVLSFPRPGRYFYFFVCLFVCLFVCMFVCLCALFLSHEILATGPAYMELELHGEQKSRSMEARKQQGMEFRSSYSMCDPAEACTES